MATLGEDMAEDLAVDEDAGDGSTAGAAFLSSAGLFCLGAEPSSKFFPCFLLLKHRKHMAILSLRGGCEG